MKTLLEILALIEANHGIELLSSDWQQKLTGNAESTLAEIAAIVQQAVRDERDAAAGATPPTASIIDADIDAVQAVFERIGLDSASVPRHLAIVEVARLLGAERLKVSA